MWQHHWRTLWLKRIFSSVIATNIEQLHYKVGIHTLQWQNQQTHTWSSEGDLQWHFPLFYCTFDKWRYLWRWHHYWFIFQTRRIRNDHICYKYWANSRNKTRKINKSGIVKTINWGMKVEYQWSHLPSTLLFPLQAEQIKIVWGVTLTHLSSPYKYATAIDSSLLVSASLSIFSVNSKQSWQVQSAHYLE